MHRCVLSWLWCISGRRWRLQQVVAEIDLLDRRSEAVALDCDPICVGMVVPQETERQLYEAVVKAYNVSLSSAQVAFLVYVYSQSFAFIVRYLQAAVNGAVAEVL